MDVPGDKLLEPVVSMVGHLKSMFTSLSKSKHFISVTPVREFYDRARVFNT